MEMLLEMMSGTDRTVWLKTRGWKDGKQLNSDQLVKKMGKRLGLDRWFEYDEFRLDSDEEAREEKVSLLIKAKFNFDSKFEN
jgi:hypothetical protein